MASPKASEAISDSSLSPASYQALPELPKSPRDDPIAYGGHPKNKDRPYPLSLIPFDLNEPYEVSEYLTIRSYDEACQVDYLNQDWADEYRDGGIVDEQMFDDGHVRRYLDRFIEENPKLIATTFRHKANLKTVFYSGKDEEWAKLDLVDVYRRQTGKVLGVPSQSQYTSNSKNGGAITPDASLIGNVNDPSSPSFRKRMLYAVIEVKWMELATLLTGEAKRQSDEKALNYLRQEGVFQTMWYVILGYAISGCIFGLSIINEYFYRIVYLHSDSDIPVIALEADSEFLGKTGRHFGYLRDSYSIEELAGLQDFWSSPPNCLISDRANAILNKEARYHLDATIFLFLNRAASLSKQCFLNGLPLPHMRRSLHPTKANKRTLADLDDEGKKEGVEDIPGDEKLSRKVNRRNGPESDGLCGRGSGHDRVHEGNGASAHRTEAAHARRPMKPQEFLRGLEELSTVVDVSDVKSSIIASLISNSHTTPSMNPSSISSDCDSFSYTSFGSREKLPVSDHLPAALHPRSHECDPVDTDFDAIDSETGELTLEAYRSRLAMLGVRVKLVTREEMDVLLARGGKENSDC
ncbi:hypothetical protein CNBL0050 [Cryptococcus deneoformans B-3501A]|uniref:hypothetical protein n=1 Tax=Cryptococcus deneoformans (strain B-3501A) TaxID=283643 RepID=UPI000042DF50|nr:hypothetical protein CNBL0050 [Cryptococcus neoformans var. neoformans B-3501A]EAL17940.1 hypothetical protein CNBL0050 [Cryptococcus neoformans var. neoformans B-3501A]